MNITESNIQKSGTCNFCNKHSDPIQGIPFPYEKVFVIEGNGNQSVLCNDCLTQLQMYRGGRRYKLILGFRGGKEVVIEVNGEPTRDEIIKAMEFHNADNYRIEYNID